MRNSGAAIFLLPVLPVFLVFTFVCLCLPPFVFVVENPALPHCLVFDRVLSEFTRSTRFPSFLLPLSSSYCVLSLPPPTPTLYHPLCTPPTPTPPTLLPPLPPYLSTYPLPHRLLSLLPPSSLFSQLAPPGLYPTPGHTTWAASKPFPPLTLQIHPLYSPTPSTQHSPSSYRKSLCKSCNVFAKTTKKGRLSPYYQYYLPPPLPSPHSPTLPKQQPVSTDRSFAAEATNRTTEA